MNNLYWLLMAEKCYHWHLAEPGGRWEQFMYFYLFKWRGYEDKGYEDD